MSGGQYRKWLRDVERAAVEQGWTIVGGEGAHRKFVPPDRDKPIVTVASSPNDPRAWLHDRARLRRSGLRI